MTEWLKAPVLKTGTEVSPTSSLGSLVSIKRGHGKNMFKITINSFFKSCCSCTSPSCVPQMPYEEEES
ncbi:hypothetical protein Ccrd_020945 [Cynara cardunculus var. scolymus]|uniref:Uncharacterized protein n=1 Tax=Cynara cardunculus var. scolymus TaxID=59895 RepID=A0A103Y1I2_CYNCS|nr:hypothetical protein Ccrd_020945 [Cynara cardunculus var. scolymus]